MNWVPPLLHAEKALHVLNYVLTALPASGSGPAQLEWIRNGPLGSRIVLDSILDGEAIDDYASVCGDAATKAYG